MRCKYCENNFKNVKSLQKHQKTAKYCLRLRGLKPKKEKDKCFYCKKNHCDESHYDKCIPYIKFMHAREIKKLEKTVEDYRKLVLELTSFVGSSSSVSNSHNTNTTTNTNSHNNINNIIIQNLVPLTPECFQENLQYLDTKHVTRGAIGYAEYASEYPLKGKIHCTDASRGRVVYKNKDGQIVTDNGMFHISKNLFSSLAPKAKQLVLDHIQENEKKYGTSYISISTELINNCKSIERGSTGEMDPFCKNITKYIPILSDDVNRKSFEPNPTSPTSSSSDGGLIDSDDIYIEE